MHTIERTVTIRRSTDVVFDAWSSSEALATWFAPMAVGGPKVEMDFRVGGQYRIEMDLGGGHVHITQGSFRRIERPNQIVMSWHCDAFEDPESLVTASFEAVDEGTKVTVVHQRVSTENGLHGQTQGWVACLQALQSMLEGESA